MAGDQKIQSVVPWLGAYLSTQIRGNKFLYSDIQIHRMEKRHGHRQRWEKSSRVPFASLKQ